MYINAIIWNRIVHHYRWIKNRKQPKEAQIKAKYNTKSLRHCINMLMLGISIDSILKKYMSRLFLGIAVLGSGNLLIDWFFC